METTSGKALTTPQVASLRAEAVTLGLSVDSKVIGMAIERRNTQFTGATLLPEQKHTRYGEYMTTAAASVRPIHVIQLFSVEWREPVCSISAPKKCVGQGMLK